MRRLQLFLALFIISAMVLTSCGGAATPAPKATTAPAAPAKAEPTKAPEPTKAAEPTKAQAAPTAAIKAAEATPTAAPTVAASKYKEAPALAEQVKGGKLPPVDQRVSANPLVTKPVDKIGKYGGTLRTASWWPEAGNVQLYFAVDAPIKWKADLTGYEPALAESYNWSDDGKTFTMKLRKGVKWSDGTPYTSADWKFWWEDLVKAPDQKLYSAPGYLRKSDGKPIDMEFPDDQTVVWKSDKPQWITPYYMAQGFWEFAKAMMKPAAYLKKFHPKYTPTAKWEDMEKADKWWQTPGYPCLFAWCNTAVSSDGTRYTYGRNPYFWRVDPEGNQLPYIDAIDVEIVSDEQVRLLNVTQGKYDTAFRVIGNPNDIPLLTENAKKAGLVFLKGWMNGAGAWPGYMVNQYYVEGGKNYADDTADKAKEIRELLRDKRFRQALSLGIDRKRVIDVAWNGIGDPKGATLSPQSWHFASAEGKKVYEQWAAANAKFDAAAANKLLDEVGMKKGADGFRQLPSGKPFALVMDISDWGGSLKVQTDAAAESKNQWEKNLGIKVEVKNLQGQPDLDTRTNEGYFMIRGAHISEIDIWTYPDWLFPIVNRYYMPLEGRYYAKGKDTCKAPADKPYDCGVKPAAGSPAEKLQALYEKGLAEKDIEKRHQIVWDAIKVNIDEGPFIIGVSGDQAMPIVVKDYMRNILDFGVVGPWAPSTPGNQVPAQWWMDK
jgi:peptide/nickel transport system substrate-binding protein